ncbi:MAG: RecX family transcriptional regulator, partial [Deltaproteobacteria bacterium]|nr:RecX family transcriptional regulator [Deltaproteobacteria bacterium]
WGRNRIINGLIEKGIAKDTANTALEEVEHEISEEETIKKAFEKWLKRQGHGSRDKGQEKEKPKAFRHLISRGFQPSLINQTLNKYYKQTGEDFDNSI